MSGCIREHQFSPSGPMQVLIVVLILILGGCMDYEQLAEGGISGTGGSTLKGITLQGSVAPPSEYQLSDMQFMTVTLVEQSEKDCEGERVVLANAEGGFEFTDVKKGVYYVCIKGRLAGDGDIGRIMRSITIDPDSYPEDQTVLYLGIIQVAKPSGMLAMDVTVVDAQTNASILNPPPYIFPNITSDEQNLLTFSGSGYRDDSGTMKWTYFFFDSIDYVTGQVIADTGPKKVTVYIGKLGYQSVAETAFTDGGSYAELVFNVALAKAIPGQQGLDNDWVAIKSGSFYSLALKADGSLYIWGEDGSFLAGFQDNSLSTQPTRIDDSNDWMSLIGTSGGASENQALKQDGTLWKFFDDQGGITQVGTAKWLDVDSSALKNTGIRIDGTLWQWGGALIAVDDLSDFDFDAAEANRDIQHQIGTANDWQKLEAGSAHTVLLKQDQTLWTMGANYCGQLGHESGESFMPEPPVQVGVDNNWLAIAAVGQMSLALKNDHTLWAWGCTDMANARAVPTQVGSADDWLSVASSNSQIQLIKQDNSLWSWAGWGADPIRAQDGNDWLTIDTGLFHAAAIKTDGTLWTWGDEIFN